MLAVTYLPLLAVYKSVGESGCKPAAATGVGRTGKPRNTGHSGKRLNMLLVNIVTFVQQGNTG